MNSRTRKKCWIKNSSQNCELILLHNSSYAEISCPTLGVVLDCSIDAIILKFVDWQLMTHVIML